MHSEMQMVFAGVLTEQARPFLRTKIPPPGTANTVSGGGWFTIYFLHNQVPIFVGKKVTGARNAVFRKNLLHSVL